MEELRRGPAPQHRNNVVRERQAAGAWRTAAGGWCVADGGCKGAAHPRECAARRGIVPHRACARQRKPASVSTSLLRPRNHSFANAHSLAPPGAAATAHPVHVGGVCTSAAAAPGRFGWL